MNPASGCTTSNTHQVMMGRTEVLLTPESLSPRPLPARYGAAEAY
jgi:hypothetical protein